MSFSYRRVVGVEKQWGFAEGGRWWRQSREVKGIEKRWGFAAEGGGGGAKSREVEGVEAMGLCTEGEGRGGVKLKKGVPNVLCGSDLRCGRPSFFPISCNNYMKWVTTPLFIMSQ